MASQRSPIGTVISGTEAANTFYGDIVPSLFIHDQYTPEIVANTLKRQKMVIQKIKVIMPIMVNLWLTREHF